MSLHSMMEISKLRLASSLFLVFLFAFPELFAQIDIFLAIPVTTKSLFGSVIHRDMLEAYNHGDKTYVRVYMTVYDDHNGYPNHKDVWQDREENIVIFPKGDRLWVGFGTPRRQLEFAYKYRSQGGATEESNNPLIRSFLVDSKVAISIMENAVQESLSKMSFDINVDKSESANQFGLREQSTELLRQNALSGSLVTYYMNEQSLTNIKDNSWGIVKPIEDLREKLAYPDPSYPVYDSQKTGFPSKLSDSDFEDLSIYITMYDEYSQNPLSNDENYQKLQEFYYIHFREGVNFHDFYKNIAGAWATEARKRHHIKTEWDKDLDPESLPKLFWQKVQGIEQDPVSAKGQIPQLEVRTQRHKQRLQERSRLLVLFEEVYSFMKTLKIGRLSKDFENQQKTPKWQDFAVGYDVTLESLHYFQEELYNNLQNIKDSSYWPTHITKEERDAAREQVDIFSQSLIQGSVHEEKIVILVGDIRDRNRFRTYHRIDNLHAKFHFPRVLAKNAVIAFVEPESVKDASASTAVSKSKLTAEGISTFIKRNFIGKLVDEIQIQSPGLKQKKELYNFFITLATQLRQNGEGYKERMIVMNKCSFYKFNDEPVIYFPELQYLWSKDTQGTLLQFENGKYKVLDLLVSHDEFLFNKMPPEINLKLKRLDAEQFSGVEVIPALFSQTASAIKSKIIQTIKKNAIKEESKRKSQQGKDMSLKDGAKDEMNQLIKQNVCHTLDRGKREICEFKETDVGLVEESVEIIGDKIKFQVYKKNNPARMHEIIDDFHPSMKALTKRKDTVLSKIHHGLGVHSAVVNFLASLHYFQVGDNVRGGFSLSQSLHSAGQLSGLNAKIADRITESFAGRVVNKVLQKTSLKVASLFFKSEKMAEKAAKLEMRSIPGIGIIFDVYFIGEDINNLVHIEDKAIMPMYIADLFLDTVIVPLSMVPELEPVVLALTLIRMELDNIYLDVLEEWRRVNGKGVLEHLNAVIIGILNGWMDTFTLGLTSQMRHLEQQVETYHEFLKNLSNIENYFEVSNDGDEFLQLDLNAGEDAMYGGLVTVRLFDNSTFEIEIKAVATISGQRTLKRTFRGNIKDVVLGIGRSLDLVNYGMTSAKLLIFPVKDYHTFEFAPILSSAFGQYFGNRNNNTFTAIQGSHSRIKDNQCQDTVNRSEFSSLLINYTYDIRGMGGNDIFLLGPEYFTIEGGQGHDSYFIPWYGGLTVIENFAEDAAVDSLVLNISFDAVQCVRNKDDLHIHYCGERTVVVKHWFASTASTFHQHLRIITNDGVALEPFENYLEQNKVGCYPIAIDLSHGTEYQVVDLSLPNFHHVVQVFGSNFADIIIGNDKRNVLNGGLGEDILTGGEGQDVYIIMSGEGCDVINISAKDGGTRQILFDAIYSNIAIKQIFSNQVEVFDITDRLKTCFSIVDNYKFQNEHRLSIVTADNVIFELQYNKKNRRLEKVAIILDLSHSQKNISINLLAPDSSGFQMSERDAASIVTIIDSKHSDHIIANNEENFISCSGGKLDYLEGKGGQDYYVIKTGCSDVHILNIDPLEKLDRLLISQEYESLILNMNSENSVVIRSRKQNRNIVLLNWFVNSTYQHLVIETEDGITCNVPTSKEEFRLNMNLLPYEIRFTKQSCKSCYHTLDLNKDPWKNVQKVVVRSKSCLCSVSGNALGNYLDLGPTNISERRYMAGGNGSDIYVVGYGYGAFNEISNFAKDKILDYIFLDIIYYELEIEIIDHDMIIKSSAHPESLSVRILGFMSGENYQHLLATTSDGITIKIEPLFPYKTVVKVDKTGATHPVMVDSTQPELMSAQIIIGATDNTNYVQGGDKTVYISGGEQDDTIHGGILGEILEGLGGADQIYGHGGNDVLKGGPGDDLLYGGDGHDTLYGGDGADFIHGGAGSNTIVFKGDGYNYIGVHVDLRTGRGSKADAEGDLYEDIQNICGSEYNDVLHGSDQDNVIEGFQGNDYIQPYRSNDILNGGPGIDIYNCSGATGRKEIWLDGDLNSPDLIIIDKTPMSDLCFFVIEDNLFITDINSEEVIDRLEVIIMNFTAEKALKNFNLHYETYLNESTFLGACSMNEDVRRFKLSSWMYVLDFSETEIVFILNGSFIQLPFESGADVRLRLSYASDNMVNVTDINITAYNRSDLIRIKDLLPGVEYTLTLSLVKCHTDLESTSIKQYTVPPPPSNITVSNILPDSFTVTWALPELLTINYSFETCINSTNESYIFMSSVEQPFVVLQSLTPNTDYEVRIQSVVSVYKSTYSAPLHVRTKTICDHVKPPHDGYVKNMELTEKGYVVFMACNEGFDLVGDETVICEDRKAVENQICSPKRCNIPKGIDSHAVIKWKLNKWYLASPSPVWEVTWECKDEFEIEPWKTTYTAICEKGQWQGQLLSCKRIVRCPYPVAPRNGKIHFETFVSSGFRNNDSLDVSCNRGFAIKGNPKIRCLDSTWTELPSCIHVFCPLLPQVEHGHYQFIFDSGNRDSAEQNDTVELVCDRYHVPQEWEEVKVINYLKRNVIHAEHFICDQGNWIPEIQQCVPIVKLVRKEEHLFHVRGHVVLLPKISWHQLDNYIIKNLTNNLCKSFGLTYHDFHEYVITCSRPVKLEEVTRHSGVPSVLVDKTWQHICVTQKDVAEDFCQKISYAGYTVRLYNGIDFNAGYGIQHTSKNKQYELVKKRDQVCYTYIQCRGKCSAFNKHNINIDCHLSRVEEVGFEGEMCIVSCKLPQYVRYGRKFITCKEDGSWSDYPRCLKMTIKTKTADEGDEVLFDCEEYQSVDILSATYCEQFNAFFVWFENLFLGTNFVSTNTCGRCSADVTYKASYYCSRRRICKISASNDWFGDPCYTKKKRLIVQARCVNID